MIKLNIFVLISLLQVCMSYVQLKPWLDKNNLRSPNSRLYYRYSQPSIGYPQPSILNPTIQLLPLEYPPNLYSNKKNQYDNEVDNHSDNFYQNDNNFAQPNRHYYNNNWWPGTNNNVKQPYKRSVVPYNRFMENNNNQILNYSQKMQTLPNFSNLNIWSLILRSNYQNPQYKQKTSTELLQLLDQINKNAEKPSSKEMSYSKDTKRNIITTLPKPINRNSKIDDSIHLPDKNNYFNIQKYPESTSQQSDIDDSIHFPDENNYFNGQKYPESTSQQSDIDDSIHFPDENNYFDIRKNPESTSQQSDIDDSNHLPDENKNNTPRIISTYPIIINRHQPSKNNSKNQKFKTTTTPFNWWSLKTTKTSKKNYKFDKNFNKNSKISKPLKSKTDNKKFSEKTTTKVQH